MDKKLSIPFLILVTFVSTAITLFCQYKFGSTPLESVAFVTAVVFVYLAAVENIWAWPVGLVSSAAYIPVFRMSGLNADAQLQGIYIVLMLHGWYSWFKGGTDDSELKITKLPPKQWIVVLVVLVGGVLVYKPFIDKFKGAQQPWVDTSLAVASIVGQILQNRKIYENWWFWIAVNFAYIPLYLQQKLYPTTLLMALLFCLAIVGMLEWKRHMKSLGLPVEKPSSD